MKNDFYAPEYLHHSIAEYLTFECRKCMRDRKYEYIYSHLGWFNYEGKDYYLSEETQIGNIVGKYRGPIKHFQSGNKETYIKFLEDTIFPDPKLSLALSFGYTAVVSARLKEQADIGTIIVNLCGASSTGKSTVEELMVSPFACPKPSNSGGLIRTFTSTDNARYAGFAHIHGMPMVLDDSTTNAHVDNSNMIYTISEGEGKARCDSTGMLKDDDRSWSGLVAISSEVPIQDDGKQAQGLSVRVINTDGIVWTKDAQTAEHIKQVVSQNYGFTGVDFANMVAEIDLANLYERYIESLKTMLTIMVKQDNLTERLARKYAVIHLTIELMNEFFGQKFNSENMMRILTEPEQEAFEDRDIANKALNAMVSFVVQKKEHFTIKERNGNLYIFGGKGDNYGSIIKFEDRHWEVFIPTELTNKELQAHGIIETKTVRKRWKDRGITKGDKDHTTKKATIDSIRRRCDCFVFEHGIAYDEIIDEEQIDSKVTSTERKQTPTCNIKYDDTKQIDKVFMEKGENERNE